MGSFSKSALAALGLTVILLCGAAATTRNIHRVAAEEAKREERNAAHTAMVGASQAMKANLVRLEGRALGAAGLQKLENMVRQGVDRLTFEDVFETELWWADFRSDIPVTSVLVGERVLATRNKTKMPLPDFRYLVQATEKHSPASALVVSDGGAFLSASAKLPMEISSPAGRTTPVVIIGQPVDEPTLASWRGERTGGLLLSSGGRAVIWSEKEMDHALLFQVVGKEQSSPLSASDGSGMAEASEVSTGVWLWAFANTASIQQEISGRAQRDARRVWGAALALAILSAGLVFRGFRKPTGTRDPSNPEGFGRYHLLRSIGEGSLTRRSVAVIQGPEGFRRLFMVKRLRPEANSQKEVVAQFTQEARRGASLVHSNIVPILDFGKLDDEYFYVQEYILGRDLSAVNLRCQEIMGRPLGTPEVLFITREVLKALSYAHTRTDEGGKLTVVLHRNLSLEPILISGRGEVKVINFGVQAAANGMGASSFFMSPERALGTELDARSDLYSLGLVMYAVSTGETLYQGTNAEELVSKAANGPTASDLEKIRALPATLSQVILKALALDPLQRFQTADAFAAALYPSAPGSSLVLSKLMHRLFEEDFRTERARNETDEQRMVG